MPELPEVETSCRGVAPHIVGRTVKQVLVRNAQLRWPIDDNLAGILEGRKLLELSRRGKYMLFRFKHGHLLMHLGMSGSVRIVEASDEPQKHDHVDIVFGLDTVLRFTDPRRFGVILWTDDAPEKHKLINHLGPEPLSEDFSVDYLYQKTRKRKQAIKVLIMDSKVVVGVGNIYANESLFMTGIRPGRAAGRVTRAEVELLVSNIKQVLQKAITQGGTTLKDFVGGDGKPGYFAQELSVYGREGEPCLRCGSILKSQRHVQRASVYCPQCQK
ncbi:bifunctional DNA-formamidopyrimidine glycosylase/DNA-(apurinic or apyrimidinic site) lyase [Pseudoteredinibacter isoporae]|uniref:Formamidopyrimidine-DNA glycosylase n=1 Tax=Pseudoteredinibacter isoporae TaxID=570281 RepID=A0A7X0MUA7_9GAMM|nr:bifunctional DNA-formamidopyrimidine glycosylase/DNA-(apurinic or apyrimidinic site) lyase [Pseudoteredinibacter isoporae]MBB6520426.1 formamidopyrimidine-DNA glycosylase [Pseudoteredinibacter isoporae]NHO85994.1 bifunctional DNA-formamidopyrimidine glycosylase/DNA-(apurinic or apyrimidinic site) lyase [Pseudoteredinibacter isoporae]NIB25555.1 bifunctional DNA-formamidopyrimidine glycosylase/DNA-(apurinic or apyrimidinic site) lyase [Pseudoteredinibacter isoporae]